MASSDVVGQVHHSGGHFYASFCIRAFSKAQHNSLINLIIHPQKTLTLPKNKYDMKIAFVRRIRENKVIFSMNQIKNMKKIKISVVGHLGIQYG